MTEKGASERVVGNGFNEPMFITQAFIGVEMMNSVRRMHSASVECGVVCALDVKARRRSFERRRENPNDFSFLHPPMPTPMV